MPGPPVSRPPSSGVGLRVFTYRVDGVVGHLVNPDLTLGDEEETGPEGCLSLPGLRFDTPRAVQVVARGWTLLRRAGHRRGHAPARPGGAARDRPPRRHPLRRPARPRAAGARRCGSCARRLGPAGARRAGRARTPARSGGAECASSSPAPRTPRCPRCSPCWVPARGRRGRHPPRRAGGPRPHAGALARQAGRARARPRGADAPDARATPTSSTGSRSWPPTAARSSRTAPSCPGPRSTCPATAGSTSTSRCCPPGAEPRRCSAPSWPATTSPGATTFVLEEGLDTGPVLGTLTETVRPDDTAGIAARPAGRTPAPGLLVATMDGLADGSLHAVPQPADGVSLAPKLTTDGGAGALGAAGARRRPARAGLHPGPRAPGPPSVASGSSSARWPSCGRARNRAVRASPGPTASWPPATPSSSRPVSCT